MPNPIVECDNCFKRYAPNETCYEYTSTDNHTYTLCVVCDALPDFDDVHKGEPVLGLFAKRLSEIAASYTNT